MIVTGQMVVDEALTWLSTPFAHQARLKHVGVDCIGLVIGVGRALQLVPPDYDFNGYSRGANGTLRKELDERLERIEPVEDIPGTVGLIRFQVEDQHVVIITGDDHIIHCHSGIGKGRVVTHRYSKRWRDMTTAVYKLPGVVY